MHLLALIMLGIAGLRRAINGGKQTGQSRGITWSQGYDKLKSSASTPVPPVRPEHGFVFGRSTHAKAGK